MSRPEFHYGTKHETVERPKLGRYGSPQWLSGLDVNGSKSRFRLVWVDSVQLVKNLAFENEVGWKTCPTE